MTNSTKDIVSMLVGADKITLFTIIGEVLDISNSGPHDIEKITEYLAPKITGQEAIPIDLSDFLNISHLENDSDTEYEKEGIITVQMIDGEEIQGIFYPKKVKVAVKLDGEEVEIPKVENLSKHIKRAKAENSPAVRNFLRRMAEVAKNRLHSAEDLMDFIERSELPLTNDGRIIAYKRVNKAENESGKYVDCYSGKIGQHVGSRVWMEINGVDPSRNRSCSHGLHVANLGYLSGFYGSDILIVLVDPANFIAVPHGETNKCRVCEYDVIGVMDSKTHSVAVSSDTTHISGDSSLETLISNAVAGKSIQMHERVQVGTREVLKVESLSTKKPTKAKKAEPKEVVKPSGKSLLTDKTKTNKDIVNMVKSTKNKAKGINPWDDAPSEVIAVFDDIIKERFPSMAQTARNHDTSTRTIGRWQTKYDFEGYEASKSALEVPTGTVAEQAKIMFNNWRKAMTQEVLDTLLAFKKAKKKSWNALGFNHTQEKQILKAL